MLKFSNVPILWKILGLVAILSSVTAGGSFYSTNRMRFIDDHYGDLLDGFGEANLAMARANRNLVFVDRSIYRLLVEQSNDGKKEAHQDALDAVTYFHREITVASKALPDQVSAISIIGQHLDAVMSHSCADVLRLGLSSDPNDAKAASQKMKELCDPDLNKTVVEVSGLTNKLLKSSDQASLRTLGITNQTILNTYIFMFVALFAFAGLAVYLALVGITRPLRAIVATLENLSHGRMDADIPGTQRGDEAGMIARAALRFRDQSQETLRIRQAAVDTAAKDTLRAELDKVEKARATEELASVVGRLGEALRILASGDLTMQLSGDFPDSYVQLRDDFGAATERLNEAIASVVSSATAIEAGSREILSASEDLSHRTERQAATIQDSCLAMDGLAGAVNQTAEASTKTKDIIATTMAEATDSVNVVRDTELAIERIKASSAKIAAITGVIDEIAFQTNLLALNAGVEAARAGDAGRGFAVVASEVRALAQRSANAAKEIKTLISQSAGEVAMGVDLVKTTGATFDRIKTQISVIDGAIADIATRAVEQSRTIKQVNTAISEIDHSTQQNAAMAEQATAACGSLAQESARLGAMVREFRLRDTSEESPVALKSVGPAKIAAFNF